MHAPHRVDAGKVELDGAQYLGFSLPFSITQLVWIEAILVGGAEIYRNRELDTDARIYPGAPELGCQRGSTLLLGVHVLREPASALCVSPPACCAAERLCGAPGGYFDPLGLASGDDDRAFKLKTAEMKHGRLAMIAFLGARTAATQVHRLLSTNVTHILHDLLCATAPLLPCPGKAVSCCPCLVMPYTHLGMPDMGMPDTASVCARLGCERALPPSPRAASKKALPKCRLWRWAVIRMCASCVCDWDPVPIGSRAGGRCPARRVWRPGGDHGRGRARLAGQVRQQLRAGAAGAGRGGGRRGLSRGSWRGRGAGGWVCGSL